MKSPFGRRETDVMVPTGRRPRLTLGLLLTAVAWTGVGCGPITATSAIADASVALDGARGAKAPQFAVYEFVSAELYLRKAREEEGLSDFQAAINFARVAEGFAAKAKARASQRTRQGMAPETAAPAAATPLGEPADLPANDGLPSGGHL